MLIAILRSPSEDGVKIAEKFTISAHTVTDIGERCRLLSITERG